ncbi:MAG TPA: acetyl-CoA C-acyltransferase [Steroidobacteraceae bacterium]|nr:acetyl-CoA C-acyltransferase [Steroidobacteraceae bacterium]HQW08002.1 acetyl-CoA C-acyltransferase [Steroidobacteraceae bacterium]HQX46431.1 acetyl-CoA C-acyltransferase [Steroidobacteraceae bacterium]HQX77967.1 acetyl-CoA C-acyltransferase [Steroidobacteraceae bacterium]HQZ81193.1 acetyl-CoA C-acyltransferase [Steroidobacteraceae bacterium]
MSQQAPSSSIVLIAAQRTPIGAFQGALAGATALQLGAAAASGAIAAAGIRPGDIGEVIMGCVLSAGLGQAPARQAAIAAGIPHATPATTINKMCGSGMKAIMMAADQIRAGDAEVVLAGGLESMTNAPYLLPKARGGYRLGHGEVLDHMYFDGLQSPFDGQMMGCFAENTADKYGFTRAAQDAFATESVRRAQAAVSGGAFAAEVTPVTVKGRKGETLVDKDETPFNCDIQKIPTLKAAFRKEGTVTAASSSSISDGAAAVILTSEAAATRLGAKPLARVLAYASHAQAPEWFTTAPVGAIRKVLAAVGWKAGDVDFYEVNEAFAVVTMAAMHDIGIDPARINVHGGACALGHPIGASGARIVTTLVHALKRAGKRRGIASLCIGGGEATAIAIELL